MLSGLLKEVRSPKQFKMIYTIYALRNTSQPLTVKVSLNGSPVDMEVDTGAAVSLISKSKYKQIFPNLPLKHSQVTLHTDTGEPMNVLGEIELNVQYGDQKALLPLIVVAGNGLVLLGRNWMQYIRFDWKSLGAATVHLSTTNSLESIRSRYASTVFSEGIGCIKNYKAKLELKPDFFPKYHKTRSVPFAIKDAVGQELDRLEYEGIIEKINRSDWGTPVAPVPKEGGKFRICGDYKVTVNLAL